MASPEKRCHYDVLGLQRDCTADEIRSAYRKLALQRHPDKLVQSGVSESVATASFQELVSAYEVLSDPRERAWYDSHRSQILFSDPTTSSKSSAGGGVPDLFPFFSNSVFSGFSDAGKGFYKVYADVFDKIYANELNFAKKLGLGVDSVKEAPVMGNLESPYTQVTAFYGYWLGFATVMDFCWADQWDAMMGPNRKSRRLMEEENKKVRKKARREYNETVRGLAEFVKKRDKRVIDMQVKRNEELERKKEEERERKRVLEMEKMEKARAYKEPEWAKVEEDEIENGGFDDVEEDDEKKMKEFYCVVCGKKFKSEKQWKNHEQSKKHKEKVAEFKEAYGDEDVESEEEEEEEGEDVLEDNGGVDELQKKFGSSVGIQEQRSDNNGDGAQSSEEEGFGAIGDDDDHVVDDDDDITLEKIVHGHKEPKSNSKASATVTKVDENGDERDYKKPESSGKASANEAKVDVDDEKDFMAYSNRKSGRRNRRARKGEDHVEDETDETDSMAYDNRKSTRRNRGARREEAEVENDSDETDLAYNNRKKSTRRNRGARKERGQKTSEEVTKADTAEASSGVEENNGQNEGLRKEDEESNSVAGNVINSKGDGQLERNHKASKQPVDKKGSTKKDTDTKSMKTSKGKKQKATSKTSGTVCDTCGEDFESRNKLYKHIGDTGHATLKSR